MKKCPSELQLEAFIRESAGGAGGAESKTGTGPSEPGGSAVFSPGGVGFGDSVSTACQPRPMCLYQIISARN